MPSTVIPCLRYRDAHAAIAWLERVFGFTRHAVYEGPDHTVAHAELTLGDGMIMLSSIQKDGVFGTLIRQPDEIDSAETQCPCLIVSDAESLHTRAQAAGAVMVQDLTEMPYGGKSFGCRDLEGHVWFVGEYDPWKPQG